MVTLNEEGHTYSDGYDSVTKMIAKFSEYFDAETVSYYVAQKKGIEQEEVLAEWDAKRQESSEHGNLVHSSISKFLIEGEINKDLSPLWDYLIDIYKNYHSVESEKILFSEKYKIAGTADAILKTTRHPRCIVDIHDFKTNLAKGIQFKSPYKKYMHYPLKHLMDCNYNGYALQLSCYAYLLQEQELRETGQERKIGELAIIFINPDMTIQKLPVPYLRFEVEAIMEQYQKLRGVNLNW